MYELRVLTGLHRGAALPLIGEQWLIGADENADLVLFDPGIKPEHCRLQWQEDSWALTALQGKVTDAEGHRLESIEALRANMAFAINGIWLTVVDANTPWPVEDDEPIAAASQVATVPAQARRSVVPFVLGFLSAAAIVATSTWAALSPAPEQPAVNTQSASNKMSLSSSTDVEQQLKQMLNDRELGDKVKVRVHGQQVLLTGALSRDEQDLVKRMLSRFQKRFTTPLLVDNQISTLSLKLPFDIVQITSGPMGHVVTSDGRRLFVGDELDGIRLVSIEASKVTFKGKQDYEVTW
ncbi:FHA domain-containing protein [Pokkaliibacter sp. MBI-7]|uniref:FHA domain-containing protein n=1 Tax=Pokkaliibacter sp. MBI-7 TaxID=3040600 RepID=UPI00244884DF|nr:FHA domain-containing protein [Pokkaliibacter sp. MBI-7]MDH2435702.1 FHA domain-containing protein [Pokkaliibacter sp. MBI-7]